MKVLRIGSQGSEVIVLQTQLQKKGYTIGIDGHFGENTEDKVIEFQSDNFLDADGIVGKMTWDLLLLVDSKEKKINDTKYVLPTKNYYQKPYTKKAIVLHHTNGWTVVKGTKDRPSMNHFNWWKSTDIHVSTAFSIDYKGNIYQHFNPQHWAYHLGLGGAKSFMDKQSIGIEITNEGYMTKGSDGKFKWYSNKTPLSYNRPQDEPFFIKDGWRGYNWYAPYSNEQYESTLWLVKFLCDEYGIKKNVIADNNYHLEILDGSFEGVYNHSNVRDYPSRKPKWDLSPAFPLQKLAREI